MQPTHVLVALRRCVLAFLVTAAGTSAASGETLDTGWKIRPELLVTGIANHRRYDGVSANHDTVAVTAELTAHSDVRPYYGGLVADYRVSTTSRHDDNLNLGAYFRYNLTRWDSTTWLFVNRAPQSTDTWMYATRLRYQATEKAKLGIEAMAPIDDADAPQLMLGYYGSLGHRISMNVLAGGATGSGPDFMTRVELVWQVR